MTANDVSKTRGRPSGYWLGRDLKQARHACTEAVRMLRLNPNDSLLEERARLARGHYDRLLRKAQKRACQKDRILDKDTVKIRGLSIVYDYWFRERVERTKALWRVRRAEAVQACERIIRNRLYMMKHENFIFRMIRPLRKKPRETWMRQRSTWMVNVNFDSYQHDKDRDLTDAALHESNILNWQKRNDWSWAEGPEGVDVSIWTIYRPCPRCGSACLKLVHDYDLVEGEDRIEWLYWYTRCGAVHCGFSPTLAELVEPILGIGTSEDVIDRLCRRVEGATT